jgi:hypothetical protein
MTIYYGDYNKTVIARNENNIFIYQEGVVEFFL